MALTEEDVVCIKASSVGIDQNASFIAKFTENTWQKNRGLKEKTRDTAQGKNAELAVIHFLDSNGKIGYIAYDDFRDDGFEKHAPFDGILFNKTIETNIVKTIIADVNNEVHLSKYGEISATLREKIKRQNVYCVEIKSTKINEKKMYNKEVSIDSILNDDFLTYPLYARSGYYSTESYIFLAKKRLNLSGWIDMPELKKIVFENEERNNSDIFIRVYVSPDNYYLIG